MSDVRIVFSMISTAARTAGIGLDSPQVRKAREIAIAAVEDGFSEDEAYTFARPALFPTAATAA